MQLLATLFALAALGAGEARAAEPAGALTCEARGLTPHTGSSYIDGCFSLDLRFDLDFEHGTYVENRDYDRKTCGGWPPFIGPVNGTLTSEGLEAYRLDGEDGAVAELDLGYSISAVYTRGDESYVLSCRPSTPPATPAPTR
jgi:hypothetical protein